MHVAYGAGILSSTSEIPFSVLSPEVTRRPFVTAEVIETDYDPSRMQDHLFIALSQSSNDATDYFQIPTGRVVEVGTQVTI